MDMFGFDNFLQPNDFADFESMNTQKLINNQYVYDFAKESDFSVKTKRRIRKLISKLSRKLPALQDWTSEGSRLMFDEVVSTNEYDFIILFYVFHANLLKNSRTKAKKIYIMEDCVFLQQYFWESPNKPCLKLGNLLDEELERLKYFDELVNVSYEEKIMYEKFTGRHVHYLPYLLQDDVKPSTIPLGKRRWDVMFIGFNNKFNVEGLLWFTEKVYPLLSSEIRIVFVGSVTSALEKTYSNINVIPYASDLDEIFDNVKVSICPMLNGTGMKVKVLESMARGLPVVCNERGVDGLPDKMECGCLVTQSPTEFANYINRLVTDEEYHADVSKKISKYYAGLYERNNYSNVLQKLLI